MCLQTYQNIEKKLDSQQLRRLEEGIDKAEESFHFRHSNILDNIATSEEDRLKVKDSGRCHQRAFH